ncbi:MAG: hypothetical protein OXL97_09765 [Chloroflexota bacterium]|nr:hypothetical protein [Chloroflexota bacterium]MDE2884808.1 hypothetical protein [Chloroflexota bacterium]
MTTAPAEDVPRYFHDYALENERQHKELRDYIDRVRIELGDHLGRVESKLRMIKAISLGIFGTVLQRPPSTSSAGEPTGRQWPHLASFRPCSRSNRPRNAPPWSHRNPGTHE